MKNDTNTELTITPIFNDHCQQILGLILPIQQIEFNVPITLDDQPDLLNIENHYHQTGGGFWGAKVNDELVGTIALIATEDNAGTIRKMFVKKEYRGKEMGTAQLLLNTLINHSREAGITDLYLGTVDMLKAAHRFYERNGFERKLSEEMPSCFRRNGGENVYYHLQLGAATN
ncbi:GNAT family N-acetyltransferase [Mucilaginibacter jinjuensis]|uniref:GNAT family N-acetyltransferase n=1 Tax=Mucilaginibacter jinjuensis TaxID=1176721 RepID=A0ABY7TEU9_9SPHI|nr:GNAT family N-acetyltransferase [Mucilaginibacter jinjuensis]WCT14713.1 GNAT family N-acetyltransferase [Mucilaginibacter jinjuensis]